MVLKWLPRKHLSGQLSWNLQARMSAETLNQTESRAASSFWAQPC